MKPWIFVMGLSFAMAAGAEPPVPPVLGRVARCLPSTGPEALAACLRPEISPEVNGADLEGLALHLARYERLEGFRVCTEKDLGRFPLEKRIAAKTPLYCADGVRGKRVFPTLWRVRARGGKDFVSDVKLK